MFNNATLYEILGAILYYGSPLLMLAGIAGFATSMTLWVLRR